MNNLKLVRVMKEYTQLKVQMDTGVAQSMLSKYETGEYVPTTDVLALLADYYGTSMDFLMDRTDVREPYPKKKT